MFLTAQFCLAEYSLLESWRHIIISQRRPRHGFPLYFFVTIMCRNDELRSRTDCWCASLCTATNNKFVTFLFWTATKTNYTSKCWDFQKKLIDTITTSNFYLKFKENNENDMAAQVFWAVFYSSQWPGPNRPNSWFRRCCHSTS